MPRITKRVVDAIRPDPSGKDVFIWDGELRGFGVRMKPSGAGAYLIQYRNAEGRTRRLVVGKLGTLTPDEARDLARRKLAAVADGADPSAERHRVREAITIAELCDWYLRGASGHVKASTLAMDKSRIDRHVRPLIGRLTRADIAKLQADMPMCPTSRWWRLQIGYPGEVAAILKDDEEVLTRDNPRHRWNQGAANSNRPGVVVNLIDQRTGDSQPAQVQRRSGPDGSEMIDVLIADSWDRQARQGRFDGTMSDTWGPSRQGTRR